MKPQFTEEQYNNYKSDDKLPCLCYYCNNIFYKKKKYINYEIIHKKGEVKYCSVECRSNYQIKSQNVNCKNCNIEFLKKQKEIKKTPNHFCSKSCAAIYNNKNKSFGTRRSKLEHWVGEQLTQLYPSIHIDFNQKKAINSELDIYIPSLNIAFELNGIFHYEPIYGTNKLRQIQENDISKSKACHEAKIDLCIIDTSTQKYFKESTSQKYLDIINNIIKERLLTS
jgi:hypothetical protein